MVYKVPRWLEYTVAAVLSALLTLVVLVGTAHCDGIDSSGAEPLRTIHAGVVGETPPSVLLRAARNEGRPAVSADTGHGASEHASASELSIPLLIYTTSAALDYGSTRYALDAGAVESNPLMQSHAQLVGWKAAQVLALTLVDLELQKRGHRNKARVLRVTAVVIGAGLAVHNYRTAQAQRRIR